jgi:O-antigen ligase
MLALQGAALILIRVVGHDLQIGPFFGQIDAEMRVAGTVGSPVVSASYLVLLLAPTLAILATPLTRFHKLLAIAAFALGCIALLLTLTRGAWIAFGLSMSIVCVMAWYRRILSAWLPLTFAFALVLVAVLFQESIADRILEDDGSAQSRIPLAQIGWKLIRDNPIVGVGMNNCALASAPYAAAAGFRQEWFYTIHNKYLLEWAELGIFGMAAFVLFLLTTLRMGWRVWLRRDSLLSPIALGLMAAMGGQMVHMLVDMFNSRPQVQALWLCAGIVAAIHQIEESD